MTESLHFYPDHFQKPTEVILGATSRWEGGLLDYIKSGKVIYKSEARGGFSKTVKNQVSCYLFGYNSTVVILLTDQNLYPFMLTSLVSLKPNKTFRLLL
jgi:hypothetical protein